MLARTLLIACFAPILLLLSCGKPKPLEVFGTVPDFHLTTQTGAPFDSHSLAGHVWVADFFFTTCPGPCPMMSSKMHKLEAENSGLELVSFTVDPAHDTPPVLAAYSKHFLAETGRWWFLTGDQSTLHRLGLDTFHLNSVDGSLNHSTRFVLVDGRMRIRGYYSTFEPGTLDRLLADIRQLEREWS